MSDVIAINDLSHTLLVQSLKEENELLKAKVASLERKLQSSVSQLAVPLTDEEVICMEQINVLKSKSANRELSLDEVKRLDLLIKNLRLIRQQSTQVIESVDYTSMKEADLVAALNPPTETD